MTSYTPPLCPGPDPGADWQEMGWCCHDCAALAHLAWCPNHPTASERGGAVLAVPGPSEWGCDRCGAAWFGTPPGDGLCPGCREHD